MSEVRLNLIDAHGILTGTTHGSVADSCVAALSAEPETIAELATALSRYMKPDESAPPFACFQPVDRIDSQPWDAGIVIIDLAARIVAAESSYSDPQPEGEVCYHDGSSATEVSIPYYLPADWLFVNSVEAYRWSCERHRQKRESKQPLDARAILYGLPFLRFIVKSIADLNVKVNTASHDDAAQEALAREFVSIHAEWLLTTREDLGAQSPRDVLLERQKFIDFDLDSRSLQWTMLGEGPPCLAPNSFAYRFAGFGTHEWVVYYDLVRHLLQRALELDLNNSDEAVRTLEGIKLAWLADGDGEYEGKSPANIIDNERRRLPQAMSAQELMIDEDCECCRMLAQDAELGFGPTFWHLDGSHMEDEFAFSTYLTVAEWEAERREREEFNAKFESEWQEREQRRARGELIAPDQFEILEDPF